ncbi:MAG: sensor histidine kinase [Planctomycetes bacterium]|nr:sensor histidine kinase [Planctomycetota bacterium]
MKSRLQHKLEELRQRCSTLQQFSHENPRRVLEFLPAAVAGLEHSLAELRTLVAALPDSERPSANGTASPNGNGTQSSGNPLGTAANERARADHELVLYRERLRSLMADLLLTEEHERRRLASDLHDGLSQTIALAQIKLATLGLALDGKQALALEEISALIEQANRAARSISSELTPLALHDLGLEPAVEWLVDSIQSRYGVQIELMDDGQPKPTDEKTRVILFRAIRELLINAAKHAGARKLHVCLRREANELSAAVEDDGVGMEPDVFNTKGFGLFSIHERLAHVGGTMLVQSAPGHGTKIQLRAPIANGGTKTRVEA